MEIHWTGDVAILIVEAGRVHNDNLAEQLVDPIMSAVRLGTKKIVIDLELCRSMSSKGVGELVACKAFADQHGATIMLCHVNTGLLDLLRQLGLRDTFKIMPDQHLAIRSFEE